MQYEIISYDVWGNARDGFNVNQSFHTGVLVEIPDDASDYLINRRVGARGVEWDGEPEFALYGTVKRNGKPVCELRPITE